MNPLTRKIKFQNALVRYSGKKDLILELATETVVIHDYVFDSLDEKTFTIKSDGSKRFKYSDIKFFLFADMLPMGD